MNIAADVATASVAMPRY